MRTLLVSGLLHCLRPSHLPHKHTAQRSVRAPVFSRLYQQLRTASVHSLVLDGNAVQLRYPTSDDEVADGKHVRVAERDHQKNVHSPRTYPTDLHELFERFVGTHRTQRRVVEVAGAATRHEFLRERTDVFQLLAARSSASLVEHAVFTCVGVTLL